MGFFQQNDRYSFAIKKILLVNPSKTNLCFNISTVNQAFEILTIIKKNKKILPIFFIKYFLINRFDTEWIIAFRNLLLSKYNKNDFKLLIDCRNNYALFIYLVEKKFDFLSIKGDRKTLLRLKNIAKKNKVTVNPKIGIIDLSNIKNIKFKINKHIKKIND